jgi:hypothetical protein
LEFGGDKSEGGGRVETNRLEMGMQDGKGGEREELCTETFGDEKDDESFFVETASSWRRKKRERRKETTQSEFRNTLLNDSDPPRRHQ